MSESRLTDRFKTEGYQRPQQSWICGRAAEATPCPLGPGPHGQCRAVCTPYREGDRFFCENVSVLGGQCDDGPLPDGSCCQIPAQCKPTKQEGGWVCSRGRCESGPLPDGSCCLQFGTCRPVRSIRYRRKQVSVIVFALVVALLLTLAVGPMRKHVVSPGELTSPHQLAQAQCASCHDVGNGQFGDWVRAAVQVPTQRNQSALCLECHGELGEFAMSPHSFDPTELDRIRERAEKRAPSDQQPMLLSAARLFQPLDGGSLACAACHFEHRGEDFDPTRMSDLQCQVCHTDAFESLTLGHPEFSDYPFTRRTRLYFDHQSHFGGHFAARDQTNFACASCHETDPTGRAMLTNQYDQMCSSCHDRQIRDDGLPGIEFFALPAVDHQTLRQNGKSIGEWPAIYPQHVEASGATSPMTNLLLGAHEGFSEAVQNLQDLDFSNLVSATESELEQVERYIWLLKEGLHDLIQLDDNAFTVRLAAILDMDVEAVSASVFTDLLLEELRLARQLWLPGLIAEVNARRGMSPSEDTVTSEPSGDEAIVNDSTYSQDGLQRERDRVDGTSVGWYRRDSDLSIRYRPASHADDWLKTWLDALSRRVGREITEPSSANVMARRAFQELADPFATGRCMKCHTADDQGAGGGIIRWAAKEPARTNRQFTKFAHRPHIMQKGQESCRQCHVFQDPSAAPSWSIMRPEFIRSDGSLSTDPEHYRSNFNSIQKADCASCHHSRGASHGCQTCHGYHVTNALLP